MAWLLSFQSLKTRRVCPRAFPHCPPRCCHLPFCRLLGVGMGIFRPQGDSQVFLWYRNDFVSGGTKSQVTETIKTSILSLLWNLNGLGLGLAWPPPFHGFSVWVFPYRFHPFRKEAASSVPVSVFLTSRAPRVREKAHRYQLGPLWQGQGTFPSPPAWSWASHLASVG